MIVTFKNLCMIGPSDERIPVKIEVDQVDMKALADTAERARKSAQRLKNMNKA